MFSREKCSLFLTKYEISLSLTISQQKPPLPDLLCPLLVEQRSAPSKLDHARHVLPSLEWHSAGHSALREYGVFS